jgi:hypothetical protein
MLLWKKKLKNSASFQNREERLPEVNAILLCGKSDRFKSSKSKALMSTLLTIVFVMVAY